MSAVRPVIVLNTNILSQLMGAERAAALFAWVSAQPRTPNRAGSAHGVRNANLADLVHFSSLRGEPTVVFAVSKSGNY
jgi:hypothetical protein